MAFQFHFGSTKQIDEKAFDIDIVTLTEVQFCCGSTKQINEKEDVGRQADFVAFQFCSGLRRSRSSILLMHIFALALTRNGPGRVVSIPLLVRLSKSTPIITEIEGCAKLEKFHFHSGSTKQINSSNAATMTARCCRFNSILVRPSRSSGHQQGVVRYGRPPVAIPHWFD